MRLHQNLLMGSIADAPLAVGATVAHSPGFTTLPAVTAPDYLVLAIDPARLLGAPEVVYVTAHTAGTDTVTILRAQESSVARAHQAGETWVHGATALDFWGAGGTWTGYQYIAGSMKIDGPIGVGRDNAVGLVDIAGEVRVGASLGDRLMVDDIQSYSRGSINFRQAISVQGDGSLTGDVYSRYGTGNQVKSGIVGASTAAGVEVGTDGRNWLGLVAADVWGWNAANARRFTLDAAGTVTLATGDLTLTAGAVRINNTVSGRALYQDTTALYVGAIDAARPLYLRGNGVDILRLVDNNQATMSVNDFYLGSYAFGGSGTRLHMGSMGQTNYANIHAEGAATDIGMVFKQQGAGSFLWMTGNTTLAALTSGGLLDLSLGPLVRKGEMRIPYASGIEFLPGTSGNSRAAQYTDRNLGLYYNLYWDGATWRSDVTNRVSTKFEVGQGGLVYAANGTAQGGAVLTDQAQTVTNMFTIDLFGTAHLTSGDLYLDSGRLRGPFGASNYHGNPYGASTSLAGNWFQIGGATAQISFTKTGGTGTSLLVIVTFSCFASTAGSFQFGHTCSTSNPPAAGSGSNWVTAFMNVTGDHKSWSATFKLTGLAAGTYFLRPIFNGTGVAATMDQNDFVSISVMEIQ